jgi:GR25 family glycosyltransferase involved in LPS biosynthesis/predicted O-methyltransferase YrrM
MKMATFCAIFSTALIQLQGSLESHFQPCVNKPTDCNQQIEGIDFIYLINLDKRPDRLHHTLQQLALYGVVPYRFPAIYGRNLSFEALCEIAVPYKKGMEENRWAYTIGKNGALEYTFLCGETFGQPILSEWMGPGQLGCALSHLSILQDAYDSGYETIWVLEDDVDIKQDPHLLTHWIKNLDHLTQGEWDILYTDATDVDSEPLDADSRWWMWRPDQHLYDMQVPPRRKNLTSDFIEIGSRSKTHSLIIRRSGMKKLLTHLKDHHLYLPIDHEIAFSPEIKLYATASNLISLLDTSPSDIQLPLEVSPVKFGSNPWESYKSQELAKLTEFSGWCDLQMGNRLMDFINQHKPQLCVEIGTFGGSTTYPLLLALKYQGNGRFFTIDAWDNREAIKGLSDIDPNYLWWQQQNLQLVYERFLHSITNVNLKKWCHVLRMSSQKAVSQFADESIDLLYLDGNFSCAGSLDDVTRYFPKVKRGGYIWLNNAAMAAKLPSVAYLMQQAIWLREESLGNRCIVFQKPY